MSGWLKSVILLFLIAGAGILYFLFDPSGNIYFPRCPLFVFTGYYCPGCGSQRAIHSLVHFDFGGVIKNNLLILPSVLLIGYHFSFPFLNRFFSLKLPDLLYRKYTPWIIFGIVILFWILRNIPFYPFSLLAPGQG